MRPIHLTVPPPRKSLAIPPQNFVRQPAIDHERDQAERSRTLLAALVVCAGVGVAVFALLQARETRVVYVPVPMENAAPPAPPAPRRSVAVDGVVSGYPGFAPPPPSRVVITAPAMPMTPSPVVAAMPAPVDYAARDREIADLKTRIDELDETVRRVRADPHWFGLVKGSTNTSRQQSSDAYLEWLDRQRDGLRRRKWALEGR